MPLVPAEKPELLAPAGGMDALRAAVAAGADAVYLGLDELNARRGAENFTRETLRDACRFAHLHGTRIYLTANVVVLPAELPSALDMIGVAWSAGVDAVIVQDLGLLRSIRLVLPEVRVHVSTQANTHSSESVRALASLGVSRITLARETSLDEIAALSALGHELGVEVESFVHGAICICYSGQCLLSSMVGGRSANRGLCAQPCRLPYELLDEAGSVLGDVGAHLLSPKDLAGINVLPSFVEARVDSLKIEGRMKSAEYVALVTGVYRGALDRAVESGEGYSVRSGELSVLNEAFSRGFTEAYLAHERGNEMMSYRRPNNRGVPIGRVSSSQGQRATLTLDVSLDAEDTIEFWTSRGRFAQQAGPLEYSSSTHSSAPAGSRVTISTEEPTGQGDRVFRVRNAALSAAAERLYAATQGPEIPVRFHVRVVIDEPLVVEVQDSSGRRGIAQGSLVEAARTRPVTAEEIAEHVGRLGGTPYAADSWDIELSTGAGVGFSALHTLRREAIARLETVALERWERDVRAHPRVPTLPRVRCDHPRPKLVVAAASLEAAEACINAGADEVQVATWLLGDERRAGIVPVVPRIAHDAEFDKLMAPAQGASRVVAGNLGALAVLARGDAEVEAHWGLNALNEQACAQLAELGAALVWLSPELSLPQIVAIAERSPVPLGVAIAGRQELMVTEHCVLMTEGPCAERCERCARRRGSRSLRDRKGYEFPVVTDPAGRTHLYNSVPLDASNALPDLLDAGIASFRVDAEAETAAAAAAMTAAARRALEAASAGREVARSAARTTSGHFFRGVK